MKDVTFGLYHRSEFIMEVNFELEKIINEPTINTRGTFLHEYTHFIQDFTYYGIGRFNVLHQILREILNKYQQKETMELPVYYENYTNKSKINDCLNTIFFGNETSYINKGDRVNITVELVPYDGYKDFIIDGFDLGKIEHVLINNKRNGQQYSFGSIAIYESMATIIEQHVYLADESNNVYHLPYDACQLVVDLLYPEFGINKGNIAALCEIALSFHSPGELFFISLNQMKNDCFLPKNIDEIYVYHDMHFSYREMSVEDANKQKDDLFISNIDEFYGLFYAKTLKKSYNSIRELEGNDRLFWIRGLEKDPINADQYYNELMQKIKYPLIIDNFVDKINTGPPEEKDNLIYIYSMSVIKCLLFGEKFEKCKLTPICKCKSCNISTPWLNDSSLCRISNSWKIRLLPTDVNSKKRGE